MKTLKTIGIAICVFLAFCVVVAIFDDNDSSSENKTEPQQSEQTEQKQETEAERQAREQKEEAERQAREKEVADAGYKKGYEQGWQGGMPLVGEEEIYYKHKFGVPTSNEEKELFQLYKQKYREGYKEGQASR